MSSLPGKTDFPVLLAAAVCLVMTLGLWNLQDVPFWVDEAYTALTATHETPVDSLVAIEHSPPLYYAIIMPLWSRASTEEIWFRVPSIIAAGLIVMLAFRLAILLGFDAKAAATAALMTAISAYLVTHSREARSYAVAGALSFWMLTEMVAVVRREGSAAAWIRYGTAVILACYVHYVQIVFAVATAVALLMALPARRTVKALLAITAAGAVFFLPWAAYLREQMFQKSFYASVWTGESAEKAVWKDGFYYLWRLHAWAYFYNTVPAIFEKLYYPATALFAVVTWMGLAQPRSRPTRALCYASGLILVAAMVLWVLRAVGEPVYLLALFPLLTVGFALGLSRMAGAGRAGVIAAIFIGSVYVIANLSGIHNVWNNRFHLEDRLIRDPWPEMCADLRATMRESDGVVVVPGWPSPGGWYFPRYGINSFYQVWLPTPYFQRTAPYARLAVGEPEELGKRIRGRHDRIYTVRFRPGHYPKEKELWEAVAGGEDRIMPLERYGRMNVGVVATSGEYQE